MYLNFESVTTAEETFIQSSQFRWAFHGLNFFRPVQWNLWDGTKACILMGEFKRGDVGDGRSIGTPPILEWPSRIGLIDWHPKFDCSPSSRAYKFDEIRYRQTDWFRLCSIWPDNSPLVPPCFTSLVISQEWEIFFENQIRIITILSPRNCCFSPWTFWLNY